MTREQLALILRERAREDVDYMCFAETPDDLEDVVVDGNINFLTLADAVLAALPGSEAEPSPIPAKKPRYAVPPKQCPGYFTSGERYLLLSEGVSSRQGRRASWPWRFAIVDNDGDVLVLDTETMWKADWTFIP